MSGLRIGLIGARRVRQGLGPFIARDLAGLGAELRVVLGTSEATASLAADGIERLCGAKPLATADPSTFFSEALDVVCVLTPAGQHVDFVEAALDRGCHVLCEKPVFWHPDAAGWSARAADLEERFAAAGLVLAANAQWPWVLPAVRELHGRSFDDVATVAMGLAPISRGAQMIGDALPHPLSVAQALRPDLRDARAITFEVESDSRMTVRAELVGDGASVALEVELRGDAAEVPREAWLALDGRRSDRCVRASDYAMFLRSGARIVDLPDPLTARLAAFVEAVEGARAGAAPVLDRTISNRARMLAAIDLAHQSR